MKSRVSSLAEALESRFLLSFASLNSHGTLSVVGTSKNNTITVDISGSKVRATVDGNTLSFNKSSVKRLWINGFAGNDKITNKTSLPGTIIGSSGNDTMIGGGANDEIDAGTGADHFDGEGGINIIHQDDGNDTADYSGDAAGKFTVDQDFGPAPGLKVRRFNGTQVDVIDDNQANFSMLTTPGNDTVALNANVPKMLLNTGGGDDKIDLGVGELGEAIGGTGNDQFSYGPESLIDSILGDFGNDTITDDYGGDGTKLIDGGAGNDTYNLRPDPLFTTHPTYNRDVPPGIEVFNFTASGDETNLVCNGNSESNTIDVIADTATIRGGSGNDKITFTPKSSSGAATSLYGDSGNDTITGGDGPDVIIGGTGDDSLFGGGGKDALTGSSGHDQLFGQAGDDVLFGKDGFTDTLDGGSGTDSATIDNTSRVKDHVLNVESVTS